MLGSPSGLLFAYIFRLLFLFRISRSRQSRKKMYTPTTPCIYWTILVKACISGLFRFGYKGELERTLSTQKKISNNNKLYVESKIKAHKKGWTFYLCSWICFWFTNGNTPNQEFVMDFLRKLTFNLN